MATLNLYLDTRRKKQNGRYPIKINVHHIKQFLLSLPMDAPLNTWRGESFSAKEPSYQAKNMYLRNTYNKIEEYIIELNRAGKLRELSDKALKAKLTAFLEDKPTDERTFTSYIEEFKQKKDNPGTQGLYHGTLLKVEEYSPYVTLSDIDKSWLEKFEKWMTDNGLKTNTRGIHLRNIRAVINYCIDEEYTTLYPFRKFKVKKEETDHRCLSREQLQTLRDYPCEEHQERYRDIFMLMVYLIGINAVDLFNLKEIKNGRIEYTRAKTKKKYSIKVEPEAQAIIDRYRGKNYLLFVLDEYNSYKDFLHRMNNNLKEIGQIKRVGRGGKKVHTPILPTLSSYWARHTWATLAAQLEVPIETISAALGHQHGSPVTSIYVQFERKKIDEANRKVLDYLLK